MKTFLMITLIIVTGFVFSSNAFASDKYDDIYGSRVDQMISFYQARLYLLDSEFKILSDIGEDARMMIDSLQNRRAELIEEMKEKQLHSTTKINQYIVSRARTDVVDIKEANEKVASY